MGYDIIVEITCLDKEEREPYDFRFVDTYDDAITAAYGDIGIKVEAECQFNEGNNASTITYGVICADQDGNHGSTASDIISVDEDGNVTINKIGTAFITATASSTPDYCRTTIYHKLTIIKGNAASATVIANNRTYDGMENPLVTVEQSTLVGGTMQYVVGTDAATAPTTGYTTSIPTATDAGSYYIYYKILGDENHLDTVASLVCVIISNLPLTVSFDANGADGNMEEVSVEKGTVYVLPACSFNVPSGKEFIGWSVDETTMQPGQQITVTKDIIVKAIWNWQDAIDLSFKYNCSFGNNLSFYFAVPADKLEGYENIRLSCERRVYNETGTDFTTSTIVLDHPAKTFIKDVEYYMFEYSNIAAKEMGDEITATVLADIEGETYFSKSDTYSIKKYAYERLTNSSDAKFKTLVVDMLNYGSCAQTNFTYNTGNLVNADLTAEQKALGTAQLPELVSVNNSIDTEGATVSIINKNVVFGNNIELLFAVAFPDGFDRNKVQLEISYTSADGIQKSAIVSGGKMEETTINNVKAYVGRIATIKAKDLGQKVTAKVTENGTVISNIQEYSVESYAKSRLEKSKDETFKALTEAMMKYGKSAQAYLAR